MQVPQLDLHPALARLMPPMHGAIHQIPVTSIPDAVWSMQADSWKSKARWFLGKISYGLGSLAVNGTENKLPDHYMSFLWLQAWQQAFDYWLDLRQSGQSLDAERYTLKLASENCSWQVPKEVLGETSSGQVGKLAKEVLKHGLYREQMLAENRSSDEIIEAAGFAFCLWLTTFLAESGEAHAQEVMSALPSCRDAFTQLSSNVARDYMEELVEQTLNDSPRTINQQLEQLVRGLQVRWLPDDRSLSFRELFTHRRGHALVEELAQHLETKLPCYYLLQFAGVRAERLEEECQSSLSSALEAELLLWAKEQMIEDLPQKIPIINSLDKQVRNLICSFELSAQRRWDQLEEASCGFSRIPEQSGALETVNARIPSLERDLEEFEALVGKIGMCRLDAVDEIFALQQRSTLQQILEVAESAMIDLLHAHPAWDSKQHIDALFKEIYSEILDLVEFTSEHSPAKNKPLHLPKFDQDLFQLKEDMLMLAEFSESHERIEELYTHLRHLVQPIMSHFSGEERRQIASAMTQISTLIETLHAFRQFAI